jgi:hypothetical protein
MTGGGKMGSRRLSVLLLTLFVSLVSSQNAFSYTFLTGEMPDTLIASGNPHIAVTTLTITDGSCVIEEGVELNFTTATKIEMAGSSSSLDIRGTSGSPAVFQGWQGETWVGIENILGTDVSLTAQWLEMTDDEHGITIDGASVISITNTAINGNGWEGIHLRNPINLLIEDTTVSDRHDGIYVHVGNGVVNQNAQISDCSITNCGDGFYFSVSSSSLGPGTITSCSATNVGTGFDLRGWVIGQVLSATGCGRGIELRPTPEPPHVFNSTTIGNGTGVRFEGGGAELAIVTESLIAENGYGVIFDEPGIVNECTIRDNTTYDVQANTPISSYLELDVRNCTWSESTTQEMIAEGTFSDIESIYDFWDDSSKSLVNYEGFQAPVSVTSSSWGKVKAQYWDGMSP